MRKFMRTRGLAHPADAPDPPHAHTALSNGYAKTAGGGPDELLSSTVSSGRRSGAGVAREPLWEDGEFPASWRALGDRKLAAGLVWLRPHEVCARPTFLCEESAESAAGRWQGAGGGALADVRLRVAALALAHTPRLLARVAPHQHFARHYTGAFTFHFWVFGAWREVVVDDRLPARAGRLLAAHPAPSDDFTLPLLEKAYAKLYGSYGALRTGSVSRALQDLSGGIVQSFALGAQSRSLTAQVLHSAVPRSTLLVAVVPPEKGGAERRLRNGLRSGCAYCVTGLARVRAGAGAETLLVRVRGGREEWSGAWSERSAEWRALATPDRDLLGGRALEHDHFWMSVSELRASCGALVLVHIGPEDWMREPALRERRPWRAVLARRHWRRGYNAGGPPRAPTAGANPQFHLQIPPAAGKCHALVALAQQYAVGAGAGALHAVGFAVYAVGAGGAPRRPAHDSLRGLRALEVGRESAAREVATLFALPAGEYVVVPHTRRAHTETGFLLRVFTDTHALVWEVNDDNLIVDDVGAELAGGAGAEGAEGAAVDAGRLRRAAGAPSLEVCRALVAVRDAEARGAVGAAEAAALVAVARRWRGAFGAHARCGSVCAYRLRALLRAAGVSVSNKVLECVVVRFARRARLSADAFLLAMARLHLAHERHRSLEAKLKSNPLSLEEMILMTVYT